MWLRIGVTLVSLSALAFAQTPVVTENSVVNAASFARTYGVTPGSLVSIFGSNLAAGLSQASSIPLSTSMDGVTVTFNDIPAPLLFVSQGQINAQLPWNVLGSATSGNVNVVVRRGTAASQPRSVPVIQVSPGIFAFKIDTGQTGIGQAIAINADGSLAAAVGSTGVFPARPARPGETVVILCTGLGAVDVPIESGVNAGGTLRRTRATPTVLIGGVAVQPAFSGLAPEFVGVNQLNVTIPADAPVGDAVTLQLRMGDLVSTDQVTIAIQR